MDRDKKGVFLKGHKSLRLRNISKCKVNDCDNIQLSKGYCGKHYQRFSKYGNAEEPSHKNGRPLTGIFFNCEVCSKQIYRRISEIRKSKNRFCSKECAYKKMKGELKKVIPIEKRHWRINRKGYLETTIRRIRILQHRWFMEKHLGRKLSNKEFVHHINGVKTDNRIDNLIVLDSGLHSKEHKSTVKENKILKQLLWNIYHDMDGINKNWVKNVKHYYEV